LRVILSGGGAGFATPESKDLRFLSPRHHPRHRRTAPFSRVILSEERSGESKDPYLREKSSVPTIDNWLLILQ